VAGYCWITSNGIRLYSCYWPPKSPKNTFSDFLGFISRLDCSIETANCNVLLTGDFNAHHTDWGPASCNSRGDVLSNMIHARGLIVCNRGKIPTFRNKNGSSIIDLTIASPKLAARVIVCADSPTLSLSDHSYIKYKLELRTTKPARITAKPISRRMDFKQLEDSLKKNTHDISTSSLTADECAMSLITYIQDTCNKITPPVLLHNRRKSVHFGPPK